MGNYTGKATGNYTWGEYSNGTTFVSVDVELFNDKGERHGVITHRFSFKEGSQKNIEISTEQLRLLGARFLNSDLTDLHGLGSTTASIVTKNGEFGEEIQYVNPPGPRARTVKDEQKLSADKLAAFRARMMPVVAGITAASGAATPTPQPTSRAPWQGQQRATAPAGAAPWDQGAPPQPPAASTANLDAADGASWVQGDAYEGDDDASQAPQQSASNGPRPQRRAAPF